MIHKKINMAIVTTTSAITLGVWTIAIKFPTYDSIKYISSVITSVVVYKVFFWVFSWLIENCESLKSFIFGPEYVNGVWVGFYMGASGNVRYYIECFEQEIDRLSIKGKAYDGVQLHGTWESTSALFDFLRGKIAMSYLSTGYQFANRGVGSAEYEIQRSCRNEKPAKIIGFSADVSSGKFAKCMSIKVAEPHTEEKLLEIAKKLYEQNKHYF